MKTQKVSDQGSYTETIDPPEVNQEGPYVLRFRKEDVKEHQERLEKILAKFLDQTDSLSQELFTWGSKIVLAPLPDEINTEHFRDIVSDELNHLEHEILINPLNGEPLQIPMIDRHQWVWEEWTFEDYNRVSSNTEFEGISPYDLDNMDVKPHEFAKEMVEWLNSIRKVVTVARSIVARPNVWSHAPTEKEYLMNYLELAQKAKTIGMHKKIQKNLKEEQIRLEKIAKKFQEILEQKSKIERRVAEYERKTEERIDGMEKTHAENLGNMSARVTHLDEEASKAKEEARRILSDLIKERERASKLHEKIDEQDRKIADLQDEVGGWCCIQ